MTDLAVIEAALKAATPGPWRVDEADRTVRSANDVIMFDRSSELASEWREVDLPDAHLIANAPAWLAELVERVKAAEAEVERLRDGWSSEARVDEDDLLALELRAEAAEATIARVRALAEEHPGTAWNSGLNLRQALRDALGGTPTGATEGDSSADDERNRFSGEDTDEPTQPILRPTDQRYEPPAVDDCGGCCR